MNDLELKLMANKIRQGIVRGIHAAQSGHPGGSLSAADVLTYLYFEEMNVDPADPKGINRDRLVLSKGHAAPALYATLAQKGFFSENELGTLRKIGSRLQGHPCMQEIPGIDMSTGSLGQGISVAVGMALSARLSKEDWHVYALLGDGELEEGQVWEAAMFAGNHQLSNLTVIVDNNNLQIDGSIDEVNSPKPIDKKFEAFNFQVINVNDGHDFASLRQAFQKARTEKQRPTAIILSTVKGKGVSFMENQVGWHGKAPDDTQYKQALQELQAEESGLRKQVQE